MNFDWKDREQELNAEIKRIVETHTNFIKSDIGQFVSQGKDSYGNEWTSVLWWNGNKIECYDCGSVDEAQEIVDLYHFTSDRTKVFISYSGDDVTEQIKFNK